MEIYIVISHVKNLHKIYVGIAKWLFLNHFTFLHGGIFYVHFLTDYGSFVN